MKAEEIIEEIVDRSERHGLSLRAIILWCSAAPLLIMASSMLLDTAHKSLSLTKDMTDEIIYDSSERTVIGNAPRNSAGTGVYSTSGTRDRRGGTDADQCGAANH